MYAGVPLHAATIARNCAPWIPWRRSPIKPLDGLPWWTSLAPPMPKSFRTCTLFHLVPRVCLDHFGSLRTFQDPFFTTLLSWNPLRSRYKCSSAVAMTEELDIESKVIGRLAKGTCLVPEARVHKSVRTVRTVRTASWPRHANTILYRETRLVGLVVSGTPQKSCFFPESWS